MVSNLQSKWTVAGATFLLWALVAASAVYWGLKFTARSGGPVPAAPALRAPAPADPAAVARLLGASPALRPRRRSPASRAASRWWAWWPAARTAGPP